MDTKQIRGEMSATRASIDHKLDLLSERTAEARGQAIRATTTLVTAVIVVAAWSWWRRRTTARNTRRRVQLRTVGDRWPVGHSA